MKVLITGACGFVGSTLAKALVESVTGIELFGIDNFIRPGSERNRSALRALGVRLSHADIRNASDLDAWPRVDWVVDAAANPSVLAGIDAKTSSRQLIEHNLFGTVNMLEFCKTHRAGFILLSTSRVYAIRELTSLPMETVDRAYRPAAGAALPPGVSSHGVAETFSTSPPLSLYGSTKLASEGLAVEYGEAFDFPVWINRCGVLAGAGQFGRADQGILSYWINAWLRGRPLTYLGFGGGGTQVRDCLHPADLVPLLIRQMEDGGEPRPRTLNIGGGVDRAISLAQLSRWCEGRFGARAVASDSRIRPYDIPWFVMDSSLASAVWDWRPTRSLESILEEIGSHAEQNPGWLELSAEP